MNLQLESDTRNDLLDFIREHNVDCDLTEWGAADLEIRPATSAGLSDDSDNSDSSSSSDDTWGELEYWDEETTANRFGTDAFAMAEYNKHAAQFYPAKVTQAMLDASDPLTKVYAPVRVLKIIDDVDGFGSILETDFGSVMADQVVVASNAWTSELLPELANYIYPCRNQVLMTAPSKIPDSWGAGAFSVGAMTGSGDIEDEIYCIRRPDGRICVGGARYLDTDAAIGNNDDGSLSEVVGKRIREFMETSFPNLAPLIVEAEWTGIIALTTDHKPIVGRMPSRKNVLVAAGYNGSGMSMCFGVGKYIANMLATTNVDEDEFPRHIRILSPARFLDK
jgi:glycine/D-amino acid oxidase-like deaminating enzyme